MYRALHQLGSSPELGGEKETLQLAIATIAPSTHDDRDSPSRRGPGFSRVASCDRPIVAVTSAATLSQHRTCREPRCQNRYVHHEILQAAYEHPAGAVAEAFAQRIRELERATLSPLATPSYPAHRVYPEPECGLRTPFQRDRDRIVHSKAFRRLKHKTQVFVSPAGDHYRTRLTHTLEVTQISRTVARALRLNEDLVEAIGLGHDLGHPPFGHVGEDALDRCLSERFGLSFMHHEHSLRVVDTLERDGLGLNLTAPVRDGILGHSGRAR